MFKVLNKNELNEFVERYMPEWKEDIFEVNCFDLHFFKGYLVNGHYFIAIYKDRVETLDFQEFRYN